MVSLNFSISDQDRAAAGPSSAPSQALQHSSNPGSINPIEDRSQFGRFSIPQGVSVNMAANTLTFADNVFNENHTKLDSFNNNRAFRLLNYNHSATDFLSNALPLDIRPRHQNFKFKVYEALVGPLISPWAQSASGWSLALSSKEISLKYSDRLLAILSDPDTMQDSPAESIETILKACSGDPQSQEIMGCLSAPTLRAEDAVLPGPLRMRPCRSIYLCCQRIIFSAPSFTPLVQEWPLYI